MSAQNRLRFVMAVSVAALALAAGSSLAACGAEETIDRSDAVAIPLPTGVADDAPAASPLQLPDRIQEALGQTDAVAPEPDPAMQPDDSATIDPAPTTPPDDSAAGILSDEAVQSAIDQVSSEPVVERLPARDQAATTRIESELRRAGYDLTGMELAVFPSQQVGTFLLVETSDSTPLLTSANSENFVLDVLGSAALADGLVDRFVLRHSGTDDEGPFVVTATVLIANFQNALETGADVFADMAVQVDRP